MPFKETCRMEERIRMLSEYDTGNWSISDLCRRYGVCRDTFYEWRKRREGQTAEWFIDHSHAPLHCPHRTEAAISEAVISLRRRFPHLGPRKLRVVLGHQAPETCWPAASTIGDILKRAGLITPAKRRRRALDGRRAVTSVTAVNDEWAADFKGWFRTRDNSRIDPLTLTDSHSRYLIEVRIVPPTIEGSQPVFAAAFRRQGLPHAIRCGRDESDDFIRLRTELPAVLFLQQLDVIDDGSQRLLQIVRSGEGELLEIEIGAAKILFRLAALRYVPNIDLD